MSPRFLTGNTIVEKTVGMVNKIADFQVKFTTTINFLNLIMPNELVLVFPKDKMQSLLDVNPDKIIVRSAIEEARLDNGEMVGVVRVYADAVQGGNVLATIDGCPVPPCEKN